MLQKVEVPDLRLVDEQAMTVVASASSQIGFRVDHGNGNPTR